MPPRWPRPERSTLFPSERELYDKCLQIGADGSVIRDDAEIYVLAEAREEDMYVLAPRQRVDHFHGLIDGIPMAQLHPPPDWDGPSDYEPNLWAHTMICASSGPAVAAVRRLQHHWRRRRPLRLAGAG